MRDKGVDHPGNGLREKSLPYSLILFFLSLSHFPPLSFLFLSLFLFIFLSLSSLPNSFPSFFLLPSLSFFLSKWLKRTSFCSLHRLFLTTQGLPHQPSFTCSVFIRNFLSTSMPSPATATFGPNLYPVSKGVRRSFSTLGPDPFTSSLHRVRPCGGGTPSADVGLRPTPIRHVLHPT